MAGIQTIVDTTLVPISESSNKCLQILLSLITNEGASMLPVFPERAYNKYRKTEEIAIDIMNTDVILNFSSREVSLFNAVLEL